MTQALPENRALSTNFTNFRHDDHFVSSDSRIDIYNTNGLKIQLLRINPLHFFSSLHFIPTIFPQGPDVHPLKNLVQILQKYSPS